MIEIKIKEFDKLTTIELYEILKLRTEVFIVEQNCIYQDCDGKDQESYHVFIEEKDKIVAYLRILKKNISYNEISIGRVLIEISNRGRGLARKLILKAIDFIENELNEKEIRISAQEYLLDFYKSIGFDVVSETYLEDGIAHVEMLYKK